MYFFTCIILHFHCYLSCSNYPKCREWKTHQFSSCIHLKCPQGFLNTSLLLSTKIFLSSPCTFSASMVEISISQKIAAPFIGYFRNLLFLMKPFNSSFSNPILRSNLLVSYFVVFK